MNAHELRVEEAAAPYLVAPLLTDQLDTFASAPEGFKRLRELMLNLAVRGRLVPQDSKDEPAEKLLERIHGKTIGCSGPFELPTVWRWAALGDVLAKLSDGTHHSPPNGASGSYMYVTAKNIKPNGIDLRGITYVSEGVHQEIFSRCNPAQGDVLYIKDGATTGVACINQLPKPFSMLSSVALLKPGLAIQNRFLLLVLRSPFFYSETREGMTGVAITRVTLSRLRAALIPLPPLAEQSRIVAKVEELMALIDALEAKVDAGDTARGKLLDTLFAALADSPDAATTTTAWAQLAPHFDLLLQTPADVDRLQQTLLQLAVKGRLVPQDPKDEPAAELLKRIRAEKERLVAEGKIKREKPFADISNDEYPHVLPHGWQWVRLNQLLSKIGAGSTPLGGKEVYVSSGVKFLRSQNVWNEGLRLTDTAYIKPETHEKMSGTKVHPHDLLFNITGASIGRCAVVPETIGDANVSQHVTIVRPVFREATPYLHLVLISSHVQHTVMDVQVGVSREGLSIGKLGKFVIPLPPLPEQSRIVAAVASLTALCDRLRERLAARRELSAKLAASLTESALA